MIGPISVGGLTHGLMHAISNPLQGFKSACQMSGEMAKQGGVTSESLVTNALKQIVNTDQGLQGGNAFVEINPDARKQAKVLDQERANGHVRGFWQGVPIALKESFETDGRMHTSAGIEGLAKEPTTKNAKVVDNLLKAGVVILGKTNMTELSNFRSFEPADGWSSRGGQTLNPHRLGGQVAGSSSGSAVAVAQGHVPLALGLETNGSVIAPAAYNGVFGLKTTVGLVSTEGVMTSSRMDAVGTFTRNIRDAAEALNAMTETDVYDDGLTADALKGKRIGYAPLPDLTEEQAKDPALRADRKHFEQALELLKDNGAILVPIRPWKEHVSEQDYDVYTEALFADVKERTNEYLAGRGIEELESLSKLIEYNKKNQKPGDPDQILLEMINGLSITPKQREELWDEIVPTFQATIDGPIKKHKLDAIVSNFRSDSYYPTAVAGYPGISMPSGMDDEGMPTALHLYGTGNSEATLLSIAYGYEQASQAIREPAFLPGVPFSPKPEQANEAHDLNEKDE